MLPALELMFVAGLAVAGAPSLSAVTLAHAAGSCPSTDATVSPTWTVTNPDDVNYEIHVLENGSLVSTQLTTTGSYTKTIAGYIENGTYRRFTSNWTYTVQLVRKSDGVVIASRVSSAWTQLYGTCTNAL